MLRGSFLRSWLLVPACAAFLSAQSPNPPHLAIPRLPTAPSMARDADLSTWKGAVTVSDFGMIMPDDKGQNRWPTVAHLAWGPDALYVAVEAADPHPSHVRAALHRRDDSSGDPDFVGLDVDPSGTGQSVIRMLVTPLGGQLDAIVTDSAGENYSYDCLWDSVGVLTPTGYLVKIRVPYTSLRRRPGDWGLRILRIMPRERRYGISWPRMSKDVQCDICQIARVSGAPVDKPGTPFMVIPFATATRTLDTSGDPVAPAKDTKRLGMDLRYSGTAVTLEGTYRPDFNTADADVDPLQINSRFKVLYPEKRPFFLEGMDLLGITGAQQQFFSRSVMAPLFGLKASGQASRASWTVLHAKDQEGGQVLGAQGAWGVDGAATRDTAAAMRFDLDGRGSNLAVLGTDKQLLGGPASAGGQSGGIYLDHYLGSEFHVSASTMGSRSHLPQSDGTLLSQQGSSTSAELDWNTRNWTAFLQRQTTSPDLVLVSGFTDLQGYRRLAGGFGWRNNWNNGRFSQAHWTLRGRDLSWWNGNPMDRAVGVDAYLETAGRWSATLSCDLAGRTWAENPSQSVAARAENLTLAWRRMSWAQIYLGGGWARTVDLASGAPSHFRNVNLGSNGTVSSLAYDLSAQQSELDRESDGLRLIRAREVVGTLAWQFPANLYAKTQGFVVRYDGTEAESVDKYLKVFVGWQPNAFTQAYLGWSGQRRRDPSVNLPDERMVARGLFMKVAYALQF